MMNTLNQGARLWKLCVKTAGTTSPYIVRHRRASRGQTKENMQKNKGNAARFWSRRASMHINVVHATACQETVAEVALDPHGGRLEDSHGDHGHQQLTLVGPLHRCDRRKAVSQKSVRG